MGAGCNYTNDINGEKSYWIEIKNYLTDNEDDIYSEGFDHSLNYDLFIECLQENLNELFKKDKTYDFCFEDNCLESTCFKIELESSYYGNSIVFNMKEKNNVMEHINWCNEGQYNLIVNNSQKSYLRVMKVIQKYYTLNTSFGAWCSGEVEL